MKKNLKVFVAILCFLYLGISVAQDTNNPWFFGVSTNAINNPVTKLKEDKGRFKTLNMNAASFKLTAGRHYKKRVSFNIALSINSIEDLYKTEDNNLPYVAVDGMARLRLSNFITFDPYIAIGTGYAWLDSIGALTANGALGTNLWVSDHFGFNLQFGYKTTFKDYGLDHQQHSVGLIFKLGGKDTDGDGIYDKNDKCPELFGVVATGGCPDDDGDGVINSEDLCPNNAGTATLRGCPDRDEDGIPDKYDLCPDAFGTLAEKGCPIIDTDNDGIRDTNDKCPELKGVKENNGCPIVDSDGDSVPDHLDKCPKNKGLAENNGCPPPPDFDNDGVPDAQDKCPKIKGSPASQGCPAIQQIQDLDRDGVPDSQDRCPQVPGTVTNFGCP